MDGTESCAKWRWRHESPTIRHRRESSRARRLESRYGPGQYSRMACSRRDTSERRASQDMKNRRRFQIAERPRVLSKLADGRGGILPASLSIGTTDVDGSSKYGIRAPPQNHLSNAARDPFNQVPNHGRVAMRNREISQTEFNQDGFLNERGPSGPSGPREQTSRGEKTKQKLCMTTMTLSPQYREKGNRAWEVVFYRLGSYSDGIQKVP